MNPRKVQPAKLLILLYSISMISLAVRDFDYIYFEQPVYFYITFLIPLIVAITTIMFYFMKRTRKLIYRSIDFKELSGFELLSVFLLSAIYIFGLVMVWHGVENLTILNIMLFVAITLISLIGMLFYFYVWNQQYQARNRAEIVTINRLTEVAKTEKKMIDFEKITSLLGFSSDVVYTELPNGFVFTVPEDHMYADFFERIKVTYDEAYKGIGLVIKLKSDSLLSLDIRKRSSIEINQRNQFSFSPLNNVYNLHSSTPEIWESLLSDPVFQQKLLLLRAFFEYFSLKGEYIEAIVYSDNAVIKLLDWIMELNPSLETVSRSIESSDADILLCYNCQDPFDPLEEKCTKCGSPRPRCIICFQDLKPEEDDDVVQLPCCGIYAHRDHIITWLKKKSICPNCHQSLSRWMNQTQIGGGF